MGLPPVDGLDLHGEALGTELSSRRGYLEAKMPDGCTKVEIAG